MSTKTRTYLDWNASAPLRPEAREALLEALERFGNPSSVHAEGRAARDAVEAAREEVATFLGCAPSEVIFTSGGTEANNLAVASLSAAGRLGEKRVFAAPRIEHPSVLRPLEALVASGWEGRWIRAGEDGRAQGAEPTEAAGFACLQAANHETGARQPLEEFADACSRLGVPWHCDAVQAWGRMALVAGELGCATAALSGHKLGAPKGVGALFVRNGTPVEALCKGGPQERGRRAGTENVAGIASLAAACRAAASDWRSDARWTRGLRDELVAGARELHELCLVNGPESPELSLPNTVNLSFPGVEGPLLVQALDLEGVAVSTGAACTSGAPGSSEVLGAMGLPGWRVRSSIRVSLGPTSQPDDVERFLHALKVVLERMRKAVSQ